MARTFSKNTNNRMSLGVNGLNGLVSGAAAITMAAWAKASSFNTGPNDNRVITELVDGAASTGLSLSVGGSPARVTAGARSQPADSFQSTAGTTTVATGSWRHIACVFDFANDLIRVYLDGSEEASTGVAFGASSYSPGTATGHAGIGAVFTGSTPNGTPSQWAGDLAEASVWTAALTAAEILALSGGRPADQIRPGALVSYLKILGDNSPEPNSVAGGPSGTITGSLPKATHPTLVPVAGPLIGGRLVGGLLNRGRLIRA